MLRSVLQGFLQVRRSQAEFRCGECGHAQDADINAARNILASGTGTTARRGAFTSVTPATREMDTRLADA